MSVVRAFLDGIVDYAGLFPPAALDMPSAVRNYAAYLADDAAWMLGRFVVPVGRLEELRRALSADPRAQEQRWRISALIGADVHRDVATVRAFTRDVPRAAIDAIEARAQDPADIDALASADFDGEVFAELTSLDRLDELVSACRRTGVSAKIRTGGVTADAFVSSATIVRFMRACIAAGVRFKATAGLHHPLAGEYRLTYADDAPTAPMHGYLTVFLAAALLRQGASDEETVNLLDERDPSAFTVSPSGIGWRGHVFGEAELRASRDASAVSFGSCSFREPVDELHAIAFTGHA